MTLNDMMHKYAYTLARVGLNVQKGQTVLVEAAVAGYQFTPIFAEECYKLGAGNVIINYLDEPNLKVKAKYLPEEDVRRVDKVEEDYYQYYLDNGACFCRLESVDPLLMEDVTETQSNAIFAHIDAVRNIMRKASRVHHCQWLIAMIPTQNWANYIMPESDDKLTDLWNLLFKLCYITEDNDVVETWAKKNALKGERGNKIDDLHLTKLYYTASNGTNLTVGLTPLSHFGFGKREMPKGFIPMNPNIPTEEICTTPDKYATNGVVYASKPLVLGGKKIENFGFRFENGKVVEVLADKGKEMLEALIKMDENACYLGECALVEYHSPISQSGIVYYTTLIDENASCHLALGRGLSRAPEGSGVNFNDSMIHVDFMIGTADMKIVGTDENGKEITIFENGDFAI